MMWGWDRRFEFSWGVIDVTVDLFSIMAGVAIGPRDMVFHLPFFTLCIEWNSPE